MTEAYRVGSYASDTSVGILFALSETGADARYNTFEIPQGTDYVVPASTEFIITKIILGSSFADVAIVLGYGDDGVADSVSAPTNFVRQTSELYAPVAFTPERYSVHIVIPTGKYPCLQCIGNRVRCNIVGYERAV